MFIFIIYYILYKYYLYHVWHIIMNRKILISYILRDKLYTLFLSVRYAIST